MERREIPQDPHHLGVPSGAFKTISEPMVCLTQTVHLSCIKISTISERTKMSFHLSLSPSGTIRSIQNGFWAYGTSSANHAPILRRHLNCLQMERRENPQDPHHQEFHRVLPKWLSRLWYVRCKPCTYLAPRLAISLNGPSFHLSLAT
jgi:hypothetical protein